MIKKTRAVKIVELYMRGDYPDHIRDLVHGWLASEDSPEEKDAALREMFDQIVKYNPTPGTTAYRMKREWNRRNGIQTDNKKIVIPFYRKAAFRVAAVVVPLLIVGGIAWVSLLRTSTEQPVQVAMVTIASDSTVAKGRAELVDNSSLLIRPGSKVSYAEDFATADTRRVRIEGEVYFNVASDSARRFVVETDHLNVNVIGTQFDVESNPGSQFTTVTLYSGVISVDGLKIDNTLKIEMMPGQRMVVDNTAGDYRVERTAARLPDWIAERLSFSRASLEQVFQAVEWYYGVNVVVDGSLRNTLFTFKLTGTEDVDAVMALIQDITSEFVYTIDGKTVRVQESTTKKD